MQKILLITLFISLLPANLLKTTTQEVLHSLFSENREIKEIEKIVEVEEIQEENETQKLYYEMDLNGVVSFKAFEQAVEGFHVIKRKSKELITLIDYSKPSTEERLFVLDMKEKKVLYKSLVAHGKNSGSLYARSFSNKNGSNKSSLGFFRTENTYQGRNGYSLILEGLEKGINDKARQRSIVIHGAAYSNPSVIKSSGRLGRSLGCPALPQHINKDIINAIKGGSLLFIYADDAKYVAESPILASAQKEFT